MQVRRTRSRSRWSALPSPRSPAWRSPPSRLGTPPTSKTTFTVGIKQDIDSLNPFTGIVSSAYEMYQLQLRDAHRLRGARTSPPSRALAESLGDLRRTG